MVFNAKVPYNDLPPLPPEVDVETKTILKETIAARSALAELKGLGATIPNRQGNAFSERGSIWTAVKITCR